MPPTKTSKMFNGNKYAIWTDLGTKVRKLIAVLFCALLIMISVLAVVKVGTTASASSSGEIGSTELNQYDSMQDNNSEEPDGNSVPDQPSSISSLSVDHPIPPATLNDVANSWEALNQRWLSSVQWNSGWIYLSVVTEYDGNLGIDPGINVPLPNRSIWETWVFKGSSGQVETMITRRTDLERGNTWTHSWSNGENVNHHTGDKRPDSYWKTFDISKDMGCFSMLRDASSFKATQRDTDVGREYVVSKILSHNPPIKVDGGRTYIRTEVSCSRDGENGSPISSETVDINVDGERVVANYLYDYVIRTGIEPPQELLVQLEK